MKTLELRRHTDKNGEQASQAGLDRFQGQQIVSNPAAITDIFCGSDLGRTAQTMLAAMMFQDMKPQRLHAAVSGLGNAEIQKTLLDAGFRESFKATGDGVAAARDCMSGAGLEVLGHTLAVGVMDAFAAMPEEAYGLAFGHSPFIELAAGFFGASVEHELASCQGYIFVMDDDGNVKVTSAQ